MRSGSDIAYVVLFVVLTVVVLESTRSIGI